MDTSISSFRVLPYVLSQSTNHQDSHLPVDSQHILNQMPHLDNPKILQSLIPTASNVSKTITILKNIPQRHAPGAVDAARSKIAEIESRLSQNPSDGV